MSDATAGRPELSNYDRDIPAALARVAVFIIPIRREPYDGRELHEKLVAGCEGGIMRSPDAGGHQWRSGQKPPAAPLIEPGARPFVQTQDKTPIEGARERVALGAAPTALHGYLCQASEIAVK